MPIVANKYTPPTWQDEVADPAIDATELQAMSNTLAQNETDIGANAEDIEALQTSMGNLGDTVSAHTTSINNLKANTLAFSNLEILVAAWSADATFAPYGYGYKASVNCTGVTTNHAINVAFGPNEALNGNYAPWATPGAGYITVYAKQIPAGTITVASVTALRQTA